jgi:hypothetical protein
MYCVHEHQASARSEDNNWYFKKKKNAKKFIIKTINRWIKNTGMDQDNNIDYNYYDFGDGDYIEFH